MGKVFSTWTSWVIFHHPKIIQIWKSYHLWTLITKNYLEPSHDFYFCGSTLEKKAQTPIKTWGIGHLGSRCIHIKSIDIITQDLQILHAVPPFSPPPLPCREHHIISENPARIPPRIPEKNGIKYQSQLVSWSRISSINHMPHEFSGLYPISLAIYCLSTWRIIPLIAPSGLADWPTSSRQSRLLLQLFRQGVGVMRKVEGQGPWHSDPGSRRKRP